jgi:uncharacterized membrane protein
MNDEAFVVNLFFTVRVFLVGAYLLIFPRISRKGLVFGTYLGEAFADGEEVRRLRRDWDMGAALVMVFSLLVGYSISLSGSAIRGNLTGTVVLLVAAGVLYVWGYTKARRMAPPTAKRQASRSAASLEIDDSQGHGFAVFSLIVCILTALASGTYAMLSLDAMPARIPTLAHMWGFGNELTDKSVISVLLFPSINLVYSSFVALMAVLVAGAKRSVRGGSGGRSAEAQSAFRVASTHLFSVAAISFCLFFTVISAEMTKVSLGEAPRLGLTIGWVSGAIILVLGGGLFRLMKKFGQGGALMESGSPEARLTGGLADNARWVLGMMYIDRTDPAFIVESRFGIGYTLNLGNRISFAILAAFLAASLVLGLLMLMELGLFS